MPEYRWEVREEWTREPPEGWEARLRQISPIVDQTSHLRFRLQAAEETWTLYQCVPAHLVSDERNTQFKIHWSELPQDRQSGRKLFVSDYQYFMYHKFRLVVTPFWILQGNHGGTPAAYTAREERMLQAVDESTDVPPIGLLPPCPFDDRVIGALIERDKLYKAEGDLERMTRSATCEAQERAAYDIEREYRKRFLAWWREKMAPMSEFMQWYTRTKESEQNLRKPSRNEQNAATMFRDHFLETGEVINANVTPSSRISVAVL